LATGSSRPSRLGAPARARRQRLRRACIYELFFILLPNSSNIPIKTKQEGYFFAWLLAQCKILTADKLMARQWPCNPVCVLCNHEQETAAHLILHCPFACLVWEKMEDWTRELVHPPQGGLQINDWWQKKLAHLPKKKKKKCCVHNVQRPEHLEGKKSVDIQEQKRNTS